MGRSSRKVCINKERELASGAPERARRTTGGNPKSGRDGRGLKQLPSRESCVRPRILPRGPALDRVQRRPPGSWEKEYRNCPPVFLRELRKRGERQYLALKTKDLFLDVVWKVTCLLVCHDSVSSIGTGNVSSDRWEFARCIADLAMGPYDCDPSV